MMLIMFSTELPGDQLAGYDATFQLPQTPAGGSLSLRCPPPVSPSNDNSGHMSYSGLTLLPLITPTQVNVIKALGLDTAGARSLYSYFILLNCRYYLLNNKVSTGLYFFLGRIYTEHSKCWLVLSSLQPCLNSYGRVGVSVTVVSLSRHTKYQSSPWDCF